MSTFHGRGRADHRRRIRHAVAPRLASEGAAVFGVNLDAQRVKETAPRLRAW